MRLSMSILILLLAPGLLASCAPTPPPSDRCAGFEPLTAALPTVDYLAAHDPGLLKGLIAHDEFGRQAGCWK